MTSSIEADVLAGTPDQPARRSLLDTPLPMVAVLCTMAVLIRHATRPLWAPDLWWHLRTGEEFRGGWALTDPGQLTPFATKEWFARSWLPDMATSWVHDVSGLPGVAWVYGFLLLALVATVYVVARRHAEVLTASLTTTVVVFAASLSFLPRPLLVSLVLLVLASDAWVRASDDLRPPWWLIPATWVWASSNGMWSTGVMIGLAAVIGLALGRRLDRRSGLRLLAVPLGSIVAAAVTPVGPQLLFGALESWGWQPYIIAFQPPRLTNPRVLATWVIIAVILATWVKGRREVSWARIGILAVATIWTLFAFRSVAWGALIATPLLAEAIQSWIPRTPQLGIRRSEWLVLGSGLAVALVVLALLVPRTSQEPGVMPVELNEQLQALPPGTPILNEYALGGWLEWEHRHLAPVIDGNTNTYHLQDMEDYDAAVSLEPGWIDYVEDKGVAHALLRDGSPLDHALQTHLGWHQVATDGDFSLTAAPGSE